MGRLSGNNSLLFPLYATCLAFCMASMMSTQMAWRPLPSYDVCRDAMEKLLHDLVATPQQPHLSAHLGGGTDDDISEQQLW